MRIARVEDSRPVPVPSRAAARSRPLHARDRIAQPPPRRRLVKVKRARFAPVLRQRHRHQLPVRRRHVPIDRRRPLRVERVHIQHHALGREICDRAQGDEHRLLRGRLEFQQEQSPLAPAQRKIIRRRCIQQTTEPVFDPRPCRSLAERRSRLLVLRLAPALHGGVRRILKPLIILRDLDAVILVNDRLASRPDRRSRDGRRQFREHHREHKQRGETR